MPGLKILITGHKGFLGSHTMRYMRSKGHFMTGIDIDNDILKHGLPDENFDVVYHFAAFVGGRKGIDGNLYDIAKNIELDRQVIRWAESHAGKIIYPSSCAAYPKHLQTQQGTPMREDMANGEPFDMYGMSKLATEYILKFAKVRSHVMRPFSIYGPGQSLDYPLPAIIKRAKRGECSVWGSGNQMRDWVHIDDALRVFEYLAHREDPITLNIGTGLPLSFFQVAKTVFKTINGHNIPVETLNNEPEGASCRYADVGLLKKIGLEPTIGLDDGIRTML